MTTILNRDDERYARLNSGGGNDDDDQMQRRRSPIATAVASTLRRRAAPNRFTLRLALKKDAAFGDETIHASAKRASASGSFWSRYCCCVCRSTSNAKLHDDDEDDDDDDESDVYEAATSERQRPTSVDSTMQRPKRGDRASPLHTSADTASTSASTPSTITIMTTPTSRLPSIVCQSANGDFYVAFDGDRYALSDLFECPLGILLEGHRFLTARHYYWYRLARHGGRDDIAARLIVVESGESDDEANVAAAAERLIAENVKLTSAEAERWLQNETSVVRTAAAAKFDQDARLRAELFRTASATLVCASADRRWGVRVPLSARSAIASPAAWRGSNLLGQCLMATRAALAAAHPHEAEEARANAHRWLQAAVTIASTQRS